MISRVDDGRRTFLKGTVAGALAVGAAAALRPTNLRAEENGSTQAGGARRDGYRIAKAEAIALPIPLRHPFKMAKATITHSNHVYVRLEDESGRVAWGETFNVPGIYARGYRTIYNDLTDHLLPAVIGMDPFEIGRLHVAMDKALPLCRDGKSGIDLAAYDLAGKQFGVPVSTLLGGRLVDEVPMIGIISIVPPAEAAEKAKALVADGYKFLKLKFGPQLEGRRRAPERRPGSGRLRYRGQVRRQCLLQPGGRSEGAPWRTGRGPPALRATAGSTRHRRCGVPGTADEHSDLR
ncbi:MAG: mandelate racemase/muconate lactonizing enzyme family protein [bacterium]|nr:mandelate racemase/muconate lactonizing enzyme family protein [bacterium]